MTTEFLYPENIEYIRQGFFQYIISFLFSAYERPGLKDLMESDVEVTSDSRNVRFTEDTIDNGESERTNEKIKNRKVTGMFFLYVPTVSPIVCEDYQAYSRRSRLFLFFGEVLATCYPLS